LHGFLTNDSNFLLNGDVSLVWGGQIKTSIVGIGKPVSFE